MADGESVPRLVLISGATGVRKTTLAKAIAHEMGLEVCMGRCWKGGGLPW